MPTIYVSAHQLGVYKINLDTNWKFLNTKGVFHRPRGTIYGLDFYKDHFYCIDASSKHILKLNKNWETLQTTSLTDRDAHGLDCFNGMAVVTNPSGMHIETFTTTDLKPIEHVPVPLYTEAIHDNVMRHHINSAQQSSDGSFYYTVTYMARHKTRSHISRRDDGHIIKAIRDEEDDSMHIPSASGSHVSVVGGLHLPHSLRIQNDHFYVCSKKYHSVDKYTLDGELVSRTDPFSGWVRGLCPMGDNVWMVGLNVERIDGLPRTRKTAGIAVMRECGDTWEILNEFPLAYHEIFDIITVPS